MTPPAPLLISALISLALDQSSKRVVLARLREGEAASIRWMAIRRLTNVRTGCGVARSARALLALWIIEFAVMIALVRFGPFFQGWVAEAAIGAALGGAAGNVTDRLIRAGVVDFVDVRFWPVFNIGDAAIVAGVLVALLNI